MGEGKNFGLTSPVAILVGSVIIALAILISGGVISFPTKEGKVSPTPTPSQPQAAQGKTEAEIVKNLKTYAGKLGLDQKKFDSCLDLGEKASLVSADAKDAASVGVQGTPAFFVNGRPLMIGASPFDQFKKVIDEELGGSAGNVERKTVAVGNLPVLGKDSAPITFIEFSDYQCPFCGKFYADAEAQIKKEYVDTGRVKIYFRDFPLVQIHPGAQKTAEAARCAGDLGKYWQYHDLIFANQDKIF